MSIVEEITFNRMDKRVIEFLLNHTSEQEPILEIIHEKLALELGTAREVISRLLKDLEKKEFLQLKRGQIIIKNRSQLLTYL
ncbi:helix-turn-helix domain-containing protein [Tepidibacillus marianensis]|uniref:helix-turn-helix domain-containing protein n=1 Tax=Tepidibacillus marianensis TaxID=3131995 RepID=UPI0030D0978E